MRVTVCIPTIPVRGTLLTRAVQSVVAQSRPAAAISIAADLDRQGAGPTRTRAIEAATTDWVALLDDDDELYPQHLERLCAHAVETGADLVFPWFDTQPAGGDPFIDEQGRPTHEGRPWDPAAPHMFPVTVLARRDLLLTVGGFGPPQDPDGWCSGEDWHTWLELAAVGATIVHLPERTWVWHHDSANTSGMPNRW